MTSDITLVAIDFRTHALTAHALNQTAQLANPYEILVVSDRDIIGGARHVIRKPCDNMAEYATIMLKDIAEHITTSHAMYVQWDGMAYNAEKWTDDFLKYDYIGAPWPTKPEGSNVGNGGFSLRSKKLLDICHDDTIVLDAVTPIAEDELIGRRHRHYLEENGIKFAPTKLAEQFSFETGHQRASFGFHGIWNVFHTGSAETISFYMQSVDFSGWNIYRWQHTLNALLFREQFDMYELALFKLMEYHPEWCEKLSNYIGKNLGTGYF